MIEQLKAQNIDFYGNIKNLKKRMKDTNPPIPLIQELPTTIPGFAGKTISMIELLFRCGFIDTLKLTLSKPECEKIISKLEDFMGEKCEVEMTMDKLDVFIRFTPKAHCEIAGKGIEYIWGISKIDFRQLNAKLTSEQRITRLNENVMQCLEKISIEIFLKCCRRTREYKLAYWAVHQLELKEKAKQGATKGDSDSKESEVCHNKKIEVLDFCGTLQLKDIERIQKLYKGKRSVERQDKNCISVVKEIIDLTQEDCDVTIKNEYDSLKKILKIE